MRRLMRHDDRGVVAITVVLCSLALLAGLIMAVDGGSIVVTKRSAQNDADSQALTMARECAWGRLTCRVERHRGGGQGGRHGQGHGHQDRELQVRRGHW